MFRFSIRDLLWLTLVVAMGLGWFAHQRQLRAGKLAINDVQVGPADAAGEHVQEKLPGPRLWRRARRIRFHHHLWDRRHPRRGRSLHEPGQCELGSVAKCQPHQRRVLLQRSQLDQLSRSLLSDPLAVKP